MVYRGKRKLRHPHNQKVYREEEAEKEGCPVDASRRAQIRPVRFTLTTSTTIFCTPHRPASHPTPPGYGSVPTTRGPPVYRTQQPYLKLQQYCAMRVLRMKSEGRKSVSEGVRE